jgi:hypothetical protein
VRGIECPVCGSVLARMTVGRITVDVCEGAAAATDWSLERAAAEYFSEVFGLQLAAHAETEEDLARVRRMAHVFRFTCPSHYRSSRTGELLNL